MRLALAAVLTLLPGLAFADGDMHPASISEKGPRHICSSATYPGKAALDLTEGKTLVAFDIEPDGSVKDITVKESSGSAVLDQASVECVHGWIYNPAMRGGQAIEVPWEVRVAWSIPLSPNAGRPPSAVGNPHSCPDRPRDTNNTGMPGTVVLTYAVDPDGTVTNMTIQDSSGDKIFDDYAVVCVSAWQFIPTKINSVPIRTYQQTSLAWSSQP